MLGTRITSSKSIGGFNQFKIRKTNRSSNWQTLRAEMILFNFGFASNKVAAANGLSYFIWICIYKQTRLLFCFLQLTYLTAKLQQYLLVILYTKATGFLTVFMFSWSWILLYQPFICFLKEAVSSHLFPMVCTLEKYSYLKTK